MAGLLKYRPRNVSPIYFYNSQTTLRPPEHRTPYSDLAGITVKVDNNDFVNTHISSHQSTKNIAPRLQQVEHYVPIIRNCMV